MRCGIRICRIRCGDGLLHFGIWAERLHLRDEERESLVSCAELNRNAAFAADLDMEAHR
jgi:hypothetical protein